MKTSQEIKEKLEIISRYINIPDDPNHGPNHWANVYYLASKLQKVVGGNAEIIGWASILHDIGRPNNEKYGNSTIFRYFHGELGAAMALDILKEENIEVNRYAVCDIIRKHCYPLEGEYLEMQTVMDADKLEHVRFRGIMSLKIQLLDLPESMDLIPLVLELNEMDVDQEVKILNDEIKSNKWLLKTTPSGWEW